MTGAATDSRTHIHDGSADINTNAADSATDSITGKPLPNLTFHVLQPANNNNPNTTTNPSFNTNHHHAPHSNDPPQTGELAAATTGHDKAFLLYPLIYILCTAPLALGRIATMAGVDVPVWYFCAAGALITSNGWLDVLLWGVTRHRLLFGGDVDAEESGLDTFAFMRTPHGRRWGNMVWVEGGGGSNNGGGGGSGSGGQGGGKGSEGGGEAGKLGGLVKRRMGWRPLGFGGGSGGGGGGGHGEGRGRGDGGGQSGGEDGLAIQMDMVTTVVVEPAETVGDDWDRGRGRHAPSGSTGSRSGMIYDTDSAGEDGLVKNIG